MAEKSPELAAAEAPSVAEAETMLLQLARAFFSDPSQRQPAQAAAGDGAALSASEARLRKTEAKYRTLIEQIPAVTFSASFEEGLSEVYVSPHIEALLGYTQSEWTENPILWYERLHPEDRPRWNVEAARTVAFGEPARSVYRFLARDGRIVWILGQAKIVFEENGLPSFVQGVGFDITDLKRAEEELQEKNRALQESNAELSAFAYSVAHDLRAPLRAMRGFSQTLLEDYTGQLDPTAQHYLRNIGESAARMDLLIRDLLDYSRITRAEMAREPLALEQVVGQALAQCETAIAESGAQVDVEPFSARVLGHRATLAQVLCNLIENAVKFVPPGVPPRVRIGVEKLPAKARLWIADNGIGIPPEYQEQIFRVFERLHAADRYPGTGIGLAIVKKGVERMGGEIGVESTPGKGSKFWIELAYEPI